VCTSSHDDSGAADSGRATTVGHVVFAHASRDADSRLCDFVGLMVKLQLACEAEDKVFENDGFGLFLDLREPRYESLVIAPEEEDIRLDEVGKVNKHNSVVGFPAAGGIKTDGGHVDLAAALNEVIIGSNLVSENTAVDEMMGYSEHLSPLLKQTPDFADAALAGLVATPGDAAKVGGTGADGALVSGEEISLDDSSTICSLAELNLGDNVDFFGYSTACLASPAPDAGHGAIFVRTFRDARLSQRRLLLSS